MLQGFTKRKLTAFVKNNAQRRPVEDMMTAGILGGLAYMPPRWAALAVRTMFAACRGIADAHIRLPCPDDVDDVRIELWPKAEKLEPDALIQFNSQFNPFRLLVETKWNAPFDNFQALKQWRSFGDDFTWQILLVKDLSEGVRHRQECLDEANRRSDRSKQLGWESRFFVIGWNQIALALADLASECTHTGLKNWAEDTTETLRLFDVRAFRGFSDPIWCREKTSVTGRPLFFDGSRCFNWPGRNLGSLSWWKPFTEAKQTAVLGS